MIAIDWIVTLATVLAGVVADAAEAPVLLITGFSGIGAFVGAVYAWTSRHEPDWSSGMGYGAMFGGVIGIFLAIADRLL